MMMENLIKTGRTVEIITAVNGDEAVQEIQKNMSQFSEYFNRGSENEVSEVPVHFNIVFMDLNMPIMDGYDAC